MHCNKGQRRGALLENTQNCEVKCRCLAMILAHRQSHSSCSCRKALKGKSDHLNLAFCFCVFLTIFPLTLDFVGNKSKKPTLLCLYKTSNRFHHFLSSFFGPGAPFCRPHGAAWATTSSALGKWGRQRRGSSSIVTRFRTLVKIRLKSGNNLVNIRSKSLGIMCLQRYKVYPNRGEKVKSGSNPASSI